jgi:hypothetical protein
MASCLPFGANRQHDPSGRECTRGAEDPPRQVHSRNDGEHQTHERQHARDQHGAEDSRLRVFDFEGLERSQLVRIEWRWRQ